MYNDTPLSMQKWQNIIPNLQQRLIFDKFLIAFKIGLLFESKRKHHISFLSQRTEFYAWKPNSCIFLFSVKVMHINLGQNGGAVWAQKQSLHPKEQRLKSSRKPLLALIQTTSKRFHVHYLLKKYLRQKNMFIKLQIWM